MDGGQERHVGRPDAPTIGFLVAHGGWVLLQVGDVLIGLPIALIPAWVYDWTPKGIVVTDDADAKPKPFEFAEPEPIDVGELQLVAPELGDRDRALQMLGEARTLSESMELHGLTQWIDAQLAR